MKIKYFVVVAVLLTVVFGFTGCAKALTNDELQVQIKALLAQLNQLQEQLKQQQNQGNGAWCYNFNKNLRIGDVDYTNIYWLHKALDSEGFEYGTSGAMGDSGDLGNTYGESTASAVSEFQEKYAFEILTPNGLRKGNGYVGPATRKKLNALYGCKNIFVAPSILVACTQEVKQCSDGSFVSRTGPNCEFASCSEPINSNYCGQLIYFSADTCPFSKRTDPVIDQYAQDSGCVEVVKHSIPEVSRLSTDSLAIQYKVQGTPTFIFIDKNGCWGEISKLGGGTKLADIKNGIANFRCNK